MLKLLGLDYKIQYKKEKENKASDALSRRGHEERSSRAISVAVPEWITDVLTSYQGDEECQKLIAQLTLQPTRSSAYAYDQGLLRYKGKLYIGKEGDLRRKLLDQMHNSALRGHSGQQATYKRVKKVFYWPGLKREVEEMVKNCTICIQNKADNHSYAGLLQPLPVPYSIWQEIGMDFIEGLPRSEGKNSIMVVIDRFSKYGHFISLTHPYTVATVARAFFDTVYKLHGLPEKIISDRDRIFTSELWKELFKMLGTKLLMSSAYHPQTDGQTERLNRCVENYLRCLCFQHSQKWHRWLAHAKWWYNTNFHTSPGTTPYQALYGRTPPTTLLLT